MELFVEQGGLAGRVIPLAQPVVTIGRGEGATASADRIALPEQEASRQHARLQDSPDGWVLIDLGSTNGTFLNGQRIRAHEPHLLHPGDRVGMAGAVLLVREVHETGDAEARASGPAAAAQGGPGAVARAKRAPHPALLVAGAFLLVVVLVGIVLLLVTVLQPAPEAVTPTSTTQMQQLLETVVPTQAQEVLTTVATLIPPELLQPLLGSTSTPMP
jgi:hypothetical protein